LAASNTLTNRASRSVVDETGYSPAQRWIILVAVMLGTILEVLDTSIVNVSIPQMMGNLGATVSEIGWVSTGYIVANVVVLPLTGWFSNYFGRRRYLTYSIILFTFASFLCGMSHTLHELILCRVLQGAGGAALLSTAQATLMEVFPRKQVNMVQAIFAVGVVFAPTVGPTVGGWITDNYSWPWIFFVNIPIGIVAAFLVWNFLRDSTYQRKASKIDLVGIGLLAIGLSCLQTVLEKGNEEGWLQSNLIITLTITAVAGLTAFIYWELTTPYPAVDLRIMKHLGFSAGVLMAVILGFGLYGGVFIAPIFLQEVRGFTPTQTGLIFFPGGVATLVILPITGRLISKIAPKWIALAGTLLFTLSMWQLSQINAQTNASDLVLPLIIRGLSLGMLFLPLTLATLTSVSGPEVPAASGLFNLARQLGGSAGIAYLATMLGRQLTIHHANIGDHVARNSSQTIARLNGTQQYLMAHGSSASQAKQQAIAILDGVVRQQASILTFDEAFRFIGISFLVGVPLILLLKTANMTGRSAPVDAH
jgi:DHA2 family multidrug resistance protein